MYDLTPQEFELLKNCLEKEAEYCRMWDQAIKSAPKLASHRKKFDELSSREWAVILAYLPELAEFAPLKDLSIREWIYILACQPQLENKYPGKLTDQQQANLRQVRDFIKRTSNN